MSLDTMIQFSELCNVLETVVKQTTQQQRFLELKKFFAESRKKLEEIKSRNPNAETSLFSILRLILPSLERQRGPYGLKTKALTDLYLRVFCIGKKNKEAQKLINYRYFSEDECRQLVTKPTGGSEKGSDFAETVYFHLRNRLPGRSSSFTIEQVNCFLDQVAQKHESNQSKGDVFNNFIRELNATELKWITKIILKEMKLGLPQKKIFEAFHPDAEKVFNVQSNLKEVCEKLVDVNTRIKTSTDVKIEIFSHFKPMLLEMCNIEEIGKFFQNGDNQYFVQTKHDGERSQIHMKNGIFKYFTRQGYEISSKPAYGETRGSGGFLTKNISDLLNKNCQSIILDGELMGYHKQKKKFGSKGMKYDVKNLKDTSAHQPCFVAFDVVLYNDELLAEKPYHERLKILESAFEEKEGILMRSKTEIVSSSKEVRQIFNTHIDNDEEGIVLKKMDSTYKPNVRQRSGGYKIKAEYSDNLINDIDAIILGGYYGEGKWSGLCNSFLVGIASDPLKEGGMPATFQAIVAVGTGFKHETLKELNDKFSKCWKKRCPANVLGPRVELPNLWLDPKDSIIVQLRATEIMKSKDYPTGYTLRFPRVRAIREDKPWHNAFTLTEFLSLIKSSDMIQKLTKRHATDDDVNTFVTEKAPKISKPRLRGSKIDESILGVNPSEVTRLTRLFNNKQFCVVNGNDELSKHEIERILLRHMGQIVQNPRKDTFCVIAGDPKPLKVKNIIRSKNYDVVTLDWLKRVTKRENWRHLQDFYPWELLSTKPSTKKRLATLYDNFYDSYTVDATEESLKRSFEKTEEFIESEDAKTSRNDFMELDGELFENGVSPFSIFRGKVAHFHESADVEKCVFQFLSGTVTDPESANYFIIDESIKTSDFVTKLKDSKSIILSNNWINDCFAQRNLLQVEKYII